MQHSFKQIARKAQQSWNEHLLLFFSDRRSIATLLPISSVDTRQILRKFTSKQCHCLMKEIASAFQTRYQQSKWDPSVDSSCVYCGSEDTRWHRVFDCPAFHDIRENYQETIAFYLERDTSIHELPVMHLPRDHAFVEQMFYAHPEINFEDTAVTKLNALAQQLFETGQQLNLYTDGSCIGQESPMTRYAAYSVVADLCMCDSEREQHALAFKQTAVIPSVFLNLAAARVTGDQGIHRAEKYAILAVAENFNFVTIHVDSQVALNLAYAAQKAQSYQELESDDDYDIAKRLWLILRGKSINFVKVKAHQDVSTTDDLLTVFHQLGNHMADNLAVVACKSHIPVLAHQYQQMHTDHQTEKEHLYNWYRMLLAFSEKRLQLDKNNQLDHDTNRVTTSKTRCDYLDLFSRWTILRQWKPPTICFRRWDDSTWGKSLVVQLHKWSPKCIWPDGDVVGDTYGVTWIELALSFCLYINSYLPVKRVKADGTEGLVPVMNDSDLEIYAVKFSEQVRTFIALFGQLEDLTDKPVWPGYTRGLVRSLYLLGGTTQPAGIRVRPQFFQQQQVVTLMKSYLQQQNGCAFIQFPQLNFDGPLISRQTLVLQLAGTYRQRSLRYNRATKDVRRSRKDPMVGSLTFCDPVIT